MDNKEYAELLEKIAARLKEIEEPISQKTISAIGEVARDIIKEGQRKQARTSNDEEDIDEIVSSMRDVKFGPIGLTKEMLGIDEDSSRGK